MGQPQRAFYSLIEAAGRWDCAPADIIGWAAAERLEIVAPIGLVRCGGETVAGIVIVAATDLMPMFRRCGGGPASGPIRRIREIGTDGWKIVTEPAEGIAVDRDDLMIVADEVTRFEREYGLLRRLDRGGGGVGPAAKYDWDGFYLRLIVRVHEQGLPERYWPAMPTTRAASWPRPQRLRSRSNRLRPSGPI